MAQTVFHTLPGAGADEVRRASRGSPAVKVCDAGQIATARAAGAAWVYYRPYLNGQDNGDCSDGVSWARTVMADLGANGNPQPDAICFRNEANATVQHAAQYLRFRDALRMLGFKGKVALGSFAVGTPDWPEWAALKAGLAGYIPDLVDLHEYWDLSVGGSATYWALRHIEAIRRGVLPASWPLVIGECGSDGIQQLVNKALVPVEDPEGRRGWQDRGKLTAGRQSANLAAYRAACAPNVRAACVFADGGNDPHWVSFHTWDTPVEAAIRASWGGPIPVQAVSNPGPSPDQHSPTNTPGLPATGPAAPPPDVPRKVIAAVPYVPTNFRQDKYSSDCHAENGRRFGSRYFQPPDLDTFYQYEGLGPRPAGGAPATFEQLHQGIVTMCTKQGVLIGVDPKDYQPGHSYLQTLDIDDDSTLGAALDDPDSANPWSNILVAHGADLGLRDDAGNLVPWDHFVTAVRWAVRPTTVVLYDPAELWDHLPSETLALQEVEVAAHDVAWFSGEGRGYKIVTK